MLPVSSHSITVCCALHKGTILLLAGGLIPSRSLMQRVAASTAVSDCACLQVKFDILDATAAVAGIHWMQSD